MKVILVDDEQLALDYLERQLNKLTSIDIVGTYTDPYTAKEEILKRDVQVIFLDISLPEISGVELAEQLLESKPNLHIVFVTAYNEYAVKAFEINALDYITKPVRAERLTKTMTRITDFVELKQEEVSQSGRQLKLNLLRQVSIEVSPGQPILLHWRTTKAQELFLYLIQHRGQLVRKSTLIDLLWPEYDPDKVYAQLYTTVYHIRKTLEPYGTCFQISNTTEGYVLTLSQVLIDVEVWETRLSGASSLTTDTVEDYIQSLKLYTGDYLQHYDYWWAESERQRHKALWLSASYTLAEWYVSQGDSSKAVSCYLEICSLQPQEEKAHLGLMRLYANMHNTMMVRRQYNTLQIILMEELNEQPSQSIKDWYLDWEEGLIPT
ncbi:Transcriptional regulatory protein YehT [compost metagenome]